MARGEEGTAHILAHNAGTASYSGIRELAAAFATARFVLPLRSPSMAEPAVLHDDLFERAFEVALRTGDHVALEALARRTARELRDLHLTPEKTLVAFKARMPPVRPTAPGFSDTRARELYRRCVRWCIEAYYAE